ncbi:MAG: sulfatase [Myxococcota bacterium]
MRRCGIGCGKARLTALPRQSALSLLGLIGVALGCGPDATQVRALDPRPNILLISLDTTRADHLSVYGYERETSPSLRALAEEGILFETAYAPSATTGPSHASLFTSVSPVSHGVIKYGRSLDPAWTTLAQALSRAGYDTAAVVSSYVLGSRFGYDRGFDAFDEDFSQASVPSGVTLWEGEEIAGKFYGRADDTTRRALDWLADRPDPERPFLLFVHYFDPHDPYTVPEGYRPPFLPGPREALKRNRVIFMYDAVLAYMDQEVGRLLAALGPLGLRDNTLVVVTGDHGEGLDQRGHWYHGVHVYEEGVRVPLIVSWPGRSAAGLRVASPVSLVDLAPSLLALSDTPAEAGFRGRNLADALAGGEPPDPESPIWLYRRHYAPGDEVEGLSPAGEQWALRRGGWKLIVGESEGVLELYDLVSDPQEKTNLASERKDVVARLRTELESWIEEQPRADAPAAPLDPEARRRLEALGYVE